MEVNILLFRFKCFSFRKRKTDLEKTDWKDILFMIK